MSESEVEKRRVLTIRENLRIIVESHDPLKKLKEVCDANPRRTSSEEVRLLSDKLHKAEGPEKQSSLDSLVWVCFPTLLTALESYDGYGLSGRQVFESGLESTLKAIWLWKPPESSGGGASFSQFVNGKINRELTREIKAKYGVRKHDLPIVRCYFEACREFERAFGRPAEVIEFNELCKIIEEKYSREMDRFYPVDIRLEEGSPVRLRAERKANAKRKAVLRRIHLASMVAESELYAGEESEIGKPEKEMDKTALRQQLTDLLAKGLDMEESQVLRLLFLMGKTNKETTRELRLPSEEALRQIKSRAIRRFRHPTKSRLLKDFLT